MCALWLFLFAVNRDYYWSDHVMKFFFLYVYWQWNFLIRFTLYNRMEIAKFSSLLLSVRLSNHRRKWLSLHWALRPLNWCTFIEICNSLIKIPTVWTKKRSKQIWQFNQNCCIKRVRLWNWNCNYEISGRNICK